MKFIKNDGGRAAAGFKGTTGDCVTRAIAIATGRPYPEVYNEINALTQSKRQTKTIKGTSSRTGVAKRITREYLKSLGWEWVPIMGIGSGCKVHLKTDELPGGTIIVKLSRHIAAVIDGVLHDIYDCSREETRCVYGYWKKLNQ